MIEKKKLFLIANSTVNYLFLLFFIANLLFFTTYYFTFSNSTLALFFKILNALAWTVCLLSCAVIVLSIFLLGKDYPLRKTLWSIVRIVFTLILILVTNTFERFITGGVQINL